MKTNYSVIILLSFLFAAHVSTAREKLPPPNILWISWEDVGPHLGAYGDEYARSPNMDKLAAEGLTYLHAYSNYPVCAPARTTIITGQYASSYGGQFMRVRSIPKPEVELFPEIMRRAGYYCTNDGKDDYQMTYNRDVVWDEMGNGARWDGRDAKQPFFSVVNFGTTHEGHSRTENVAWVKEIGKALGSNRHDPEKAPVPPYLPDEEMIRKNIALYYDNMTYTDSTSNLLLERLEEEGLAENTIVMFWGDHGWGLPRGKRWPYQSGLQVPLIIRIPEKYREAMLGSRNYKPGDKVEELVSFVDFAPTLLSMAGIDIPDYMQGQAFLGEAAGPPREYVYGGRGRMDETYECMRTVIDQDYLYVRNYMWHLPYAQTVRTMERQPIMQNWRRMHKEGTLTEAQETFFQYPKPVEELYVLKDDPHQINNVAGDEEYNEVLKRFREANKNWMKNIHDVGLITEPVIDMMRWENGKWPETANPVFSTNYRNYWNGDVKVSIGCPTEGADVLWKYRNDNNWRVYKKQVVVGPNDVVQAKAIRLGFYDSETKEFRLGIEKPEEVDNTDYIPWQQKVEDANLVEKLIKLKELDLKGKEALDEWYTHLKDEAQSARYWATVGIRVLSETADEKEKAKQTFYRLITDSSPIVRAEAAYGLCEMGDFDTGIAVFKNLLDHKQSAVRLYALNQLDKMGKKAEMVLPFPEIPAGTANHYTHRIMIRIYKRLGIEPQDLDYATPEQVNDIQRIYNTIFIENLWNYGFNEN